MAFALSTILALITVSDTIGGMCARGALLLPYAHMGFVSSETLESFVAWHLF